MIRRPPRSTLSSSSAASDVYKRQTKTPSPTSDPWIPSRRPEAHPRPAPAHRPHVAEAAMPASDDHPTIKNLGTVYELRGDGLRYMRRRIGTADRNGDPLDGIVNLFNVALVLAVGFLVAALSAAGLSGLLTNQNMTIVTNPG